MERKEAMQDSCNVFVIGGGPGGSAAAALLARHGLVVLLAERESFPRFRIGESLIPMINPVLKELGVWEKMHEAGFLRKYGAEFFNAWGTLRVHNIFANGMLPGLDYTFQVERAKFDQLLLDHAIEAGAGVLQPARVTKSVPDAEGWTLTVEEGDISRTIRSRYLLDASGRDAVTGRATTAARDTLPYPKRIAVYNHFTGVKRAEGREAGNILIVRIDNGWFWLIPIDEHRTSVGVVTLLEGRLGEPETHFKTMVDQSPLVRRLMAEAKPSDIWRVTSDYSFSHVDYAGDRLLRVGDSAGFIDPIFSSGVFLAMESARDAANLLASAAAADRAITAREQTDYTSRIKRGVGTFRKLIEAFYDDAAFAVFMNPTNRFNLFPAVNSVVAGNTRLAFPVWWRFQLFLLICRMNRYLPIVKR